MNVTRDPERNEINALLDFVGDLAGKRVGVLVSGGNVDLAYAHELFQQLPDE